jgi:predicted PurR-regulated permease PerM
LNRPKFMRSDSLQTVRHQVFERIASLLWVIVLALTIAFCFFASSFCITLVLATFLSILVDPTVTFLERWCLPRSVSSALLISAGVLTLALAGYGSYNRISTFVEAFPNYADRIGRIVEPLQHKIAKVEESAGQINPEKAKKITEVRVKQAPTWPSYLVRGFGSASSAVLILGVVPFLMFFMLTRKEKWYQTMAQVVGPRIDPVEFSNRLASMVRRFMLGNLLAGALMVTVTVALLLVLRIQGALVLGVVSGFLNLIPFLGFVPAALIPMVAALVQSTPASTLLIIGFAVILIHLLSSNFLFPHLHGSGMNIGPVAATAGILFWGWLWGFMGVLLAVPLTGVVKLIADCHPALLHLSNMLGKSSEPQQQAVSHEKDIDLSAITASDIPD